MTELPDWVAWTVAIGSPVLTSAGVAWAARLNRRGVTRSEELAEREETLRLLRWAAELAGSKNPEQIRLGVSELEALSRSGMLGTNGQIFICAALEAAVSEVIEEIENAGVPVDEVDVELDTGQRDAARLLIRLREESGAAVSPALRLIANAEARPGAAPGAESVDEPEPAGGDTELGDLDPIEDAEAEDSDDLSEEERVRARRAARRAARQGRDPGGRDQSGRNPGARPRDRRQRAS